MNSVYAKMFRLVFVSPLFAFIWVGAIMSHAADDYQLGADSKWQDGVPKGRLSKHSWKSQIFSDTQREYEVYVPAQYDGSAPACVMVFQDGHAYANEDGQFRVPIVFDNLIHKDQMPITIGIFINPGYHGDAKPDTP